MALQGMGAAGAARQRALQNLQGLQLAGILSRRPELATLTLAQALQDPEIDAIAVSLENMAHAAAVRAALEAGKHVLCDYPLALTRREAETLYDLARKKNRILQVEHLGLLTEEHDAVKKEVARKGPLIKGEYVFQGGWNEKIADIKRTGPYPIVAYSRMMQVADWFGTFVIESHEIKNSEQGFFLHLHLRFDHGGMLGFTEERLPGLPRRRTLSARLRDGVTHWKAGPGSGGLFAKDLEWFRDRILLNQPPYYNELKMLSVLGELEKLL